jgi:hypothetical protein
VEPILQTKKEKRDAAIADAERLKVQMENKKAYAFEKDITMLSYVTKPRQSVILISTQHHEPGTGMDKRQKVKPQMILDYNATKGAYSSSTCF